MKSISLNGWQRLWAVLTVLGLLVIALVVLFRWPTFEKFQDYPRYYDSLSSDARNWVIDPRRPFYWDTQSITAEFPNGPLRFREDIKPEKMQAIAREYASIVQGRVDAARKWMLMTAGAGWLAGAVALYLLGWAVGWVIRGFRPTGKSPDQN